MIKGMTLPKGGNRLPLILGLVLGLVAAVLVVVYLSSAKDDTGGGLDITPDGGVPVVVAARDIPANTKLTAADLAIASFSEAPAGAFGTIDEAVVDKVTRVAIVTGDSVLESKISGSISVVPIGEDPPLAFVIGQGMRGVSVGVSSQIGAGGNIRPGDFVDVVLIVEVKPVEGSAETQGTSDQLATTILQNVKVLAIDQSITNPNAETSTDPDAAKSADESATTLTLEVTPTQGEVLTMAEVCGSNHGGRLSVSLRAPGDIAIRTDRPVHDGPPPTCSAVLGISNLGG